MWKRVDLGESQIEWFVEKQQSKANLDKKWNDIPIHVIIHIIIHSKLREKEVVVIAGEFNGHLRSNAEACADTAFQRG